MKYYVKETPYPKRSNMCVGSKIITLKNFAVQWKCMNGVVGTIIDIVHVTPNDLRTYINAYPSCAIVNFLSSVIPHDNNDMFVILQLGRTYI